MNYSINLYLKNKKKFETINKLISEIEDINRESNKFDNELREFQNRMLKDFAGKTMRTGVTYGTRPIVIGKYGFGTMSEYRNRAQFRESLVDEEFLVFLKENKLLFNKIKSMIRKPEKKEVLSIFVRNAEDEKKSIREFTMKVGKNIIDPEDMKSIFIDTIRTKMGHSIGVEIKAIKQDSGSFSIDDSESIENNMIKEQLYLPIWKLLIKMKRYALKQKRQAGKKFIRMKKELEPFWVLDKLAEASV